jgi:hypothetical protein
MRAGYPETEKTAACITLYLAFCMFVYGLFGFSFYKMLQPRHITNVGLAAYKPPVATVIGYDPTERLAYIGPMLIEEDASYETFDETTVASSRNLSLVQWQFDAERRRLPAMFDIQVVHGLGLPLLQETRKCWPVISGNRCAQFLPPLPQRFHSNSRICAETAGECCPQICRL